MEIKEAFDLLMAAKRNDIFCQSTPEELDLVMDYIEPRKDVLPMPSDQKGIVEMLVWYIELARREKQAVGHGVAPNYQENKDIITTIAADAKTTIYPVDEKQK